MADIQSAINDAKQAAADMTANEANLAEGGNEVIEACVTPNGSVTTFTKPSMDSVVASSGIIPRNVSYLKINEFGMRVGKHKDFLTTIEAKISMVEEEGFQVKHTIRYGNPAQYLSTYDGVVCDKGGSWNDALRKAQNADPKFKTYPTADIIFIISKPLKLKDETIPAGTQIGYVPSPSGFSDWSDFYQEVKKAEKLGQEVSVKLTAREINHNGNTWGVVGFELID